jgi:hypothetical protein
MKSSLLYVCVLKFKLSFGSASFCDCAQGKSTILEAVVKGLEERGRNVVVVAPTGVAAVNVGGNTVHSQFGIPVRPRSVNGIPVRPRSVKDVVGFLRKRKSDTIEMYRSTDAVVIDEVSMLNPKDFKYLNDLASMIRRQPAVSFHAKKAEETYTSSTNGGRFSKIQLPDKNKKTATEKPKVNATKPFGGMQLILLGDFFQLPPVVTEEEMIKREEQFERTGIEVPNYVFQTALWRALDLKVIELNQIWRQSNPHFSKMLNRIRIGRHTPADVAELKTRTFKELRKAGVPIPGDVLPAGTPPLPEPVYVLPKNNEVDKRNREKLAALPHPEKFLDVTISFKTDTVPTRASDCLPRLLRPGKGDDLLDDEATNSNKKQKREGGEPRLPLAVRQQALDNMVEKGIFGRGSWLRKDGLTLKIGATVMLRHNLEVKNGLVNGAVGKVVGYSGDDPIVYFTIRGKPSITQTIYRVTIRYGSLKNGWVDVSAYPLLLAFAITVHKSQGMTLQTAVMKLNKSMGVPHLFYVALSRVKSLEGLYLEDFDARHIIVDEVVQAFFDAIYNKTAKAKLQAFVDTLPQKQMTQNSDKNGKRKLPSTPMNKTAKENNKKQKIMKQFDVPKLSVFDSPSTAGDEEEASKKKEYQKSLKTATGGALQRKIKSMQQELKPVSDRFGEAMRKMLKERQERETTSKFTSNLKLPKGQITPKFKTGGGGQFSVPGTTTKTNTKRKTPSSVSFNLSTSPSSSSFFAPKRQKSSSEGMDAPLFTDPRSCSSSSSSSSSVPAIVDL